MKANEGNTVVDTVAFDGLRTLPTKGPTSVRPISEGTKLSAGASVYPIQIDVYEPVPEEADQRHWMETALDHGMDSMNNTTHDRAMALAKQSASIYLDDSAIKDIQEHTFSRILRTTIIQASNKQQHIHDVEGKSINPPAPMKRPEDMTPDELVSLRKRDPDAWDELTKMNTIVSFGMAKATKDDLEKSRKSKEKKNEPKVTFDDVIEVGQAPLDDQHDDDAERVGRKRRDK